MNHVIKCIFGNVEPTLAIRGLRPSIQVMAGTSFGFVLEIVDSAGLPLELDGSVTLYVSQGSEKKAGVHGVKTTSAPDTGYPNRWTLAFSQTQTRMFKPGRWLLDAVHVSTTLEVTPLLNATTFVVHQNPAL